MPSQSSDRMTKRELYEKALEEIMGWRWERWMGGTASEFQAKLSREIEERTREYDEAEDR